MSSDAGYKPYDSSVERGKMSSHDRDNRIGSGYMSSLTGDKPYDSGVKRGWMSPIRDTNHMTAVFRVAG